eukprot:g1514.t1
MATHSHNSQSSSSLTFSKKPRPVRRDDCLVQDCQNLAKLDYETPFRDIFDAVDRLLPFHILHSDSGRKQDSEFSKRKSFEASSERRNRELQSRSEKIRTRLESIEEFYSSAKRRRVEEEYRLEKLVSQSVREYHFLNDKFKLRNTSVVENSIRTMETVLPSGKLATNVQNTSTVSASQERLRSLPPRLETKLQFPSLEYSHTDFVKRQYQQQQ